jgi:hypothetical protein
MTPLSLRNDQHGFWNPAAALSEAAARTDQAGMGAAGLFEALS